MGDIADMMLDGTLDCEDGSYIGEPCGYPRTAGRRQNMSEHDKDGELEPIEQPEAVRDRPRKPVSV